ncbi:MAG TPA: hypothetical protein VHI55_00335 [Gaiellaceae bacterium]|jgi:hypothetical protein|nr:hypothetical protein [Gaiellaceae bacterium]
MRAILVIALALGVLLVGSGTASGERSGHKATLDLVKPAPLTLKGTSFHSRERVRLVVVATQEKTTKRLTAGPGGAFVVRFSELAVDRCSGLTATAIGARGSRARLSSPNVYCPPA